MLIAVQQIVNLFHREMQNRPRFVAGNLFILKGELKSNNSSSDAMIKYIRTHKAPNYVAMNLFRADAGVNRIRGKSAGQFTSPSLIQSFPYSSLLHAHTHTHTHTHSCTLSQARFRWFSGDFTAAVLLMVPVKHETLRFPPNHTHMHCLWAAIQNIHRQRATRGWRQLCQAHKSC